MNNSDFTFKINLDRLAKKEYSTLEQSIPLLFLFLTIFGFSLLLILSALGSVGDYSFYLLLLFTVTFVSQFVYFIVAHIFQRKRIQNKISLSINDLSIDAICRIILDYPVDSFFLRRYVCSSKVIKKLELISQKNNLPPIADILKQIVLDSRILIDQIRIENFCYYLRYLDIEDQKAIIGLLIEKVNSDLNEQSNTQFIIRNIRYYRSEDSSIQRFFNIFMINLAFIMWFFIEIFQILLLYLFSDFNVSYFNFDVFYIIGGIIIVFGLIFSFAAINDVSYSSSFE